MLAYTLECSSYKAGCHVSVLGKGNESGYWQSEAGMLPHCIWIHLPCALLIRKLSLLFSPSKDESYCPRRMVISVGSYSGDLKEWRVLEIGEDQEEFVWNEVEIGCKAACLSVLIIENHGNGRDSRVRGLKLE